jgi:hypothetical protein
VLPAQSPCLNPFALVLALLWGQQDISITSSKNWLSTCVALNRSFWVWWHQFWKEDTQVADRHMEKRSTAGIIREVQISWHLSQWLSSKKMTSDDKDVKDGNPVPSWHSVNYTFMMESSMEAPPKIKNYSHPTTRYLSKENEITMSERHLQTRVQGSSAHKSQEWAEVSISGEIFKEMWDTDRTFILP